VGLRQAGDGRIVISVRDEGIGLPQGFDPKAGKGLGMRIVNALARQLDAEIEVEARQPGTEIRLLMNLEAKS